MRHLLSILFSFLSVYGYVRQQRYELLAGVLTGQPRVTVPQESHMMCASRCSKQHYVYCTSYSYTPDGMCLIYPTWCWATEPSEAQPGVISYTKPTTYVGPCHNGGIALNDTCYFHRYSSTPLTWEAAQVACAETLGSCSRLAQPRDRLTYELLMTKTWRPNDMEWIGATDTDGDGLLTNLDGSQPSWQPPIVSHAAAGPVFLPAGYAREVHRATPVHAGIHRFVCEAPVDWRLREPCPDGWLLFNTGCFRLITEPRTWMDAHLHCRSLGPWGRIADISSDQWGVIWEAFFKSSGGRSYVGFRDEEIEGHWVNIGNQTAGVINWSSRQPDNGGGVEDCMEMIGDLANDISCTSLKQFVCRIDRIPC